MATSTGSKVITYDRAGGSESDEVSGPWRGENAVSDLETGLRQLGVEDVVLVSHSIAGEVATHFVYKNPGWGSGAVLVDANVPDFSTDPANGVLKSVGQPRSSSRCRWIIRRSASGPQDGERPGRYTMPCPTSRSAVTEGSWA